MIVPRTLLGSLLIWEDISHAYLLARIKAKKRVECGEEHSLVHRINNKAELTLYEECDSTDEVHPKSATVPEFLISHRIKLEVISGSLAQRPIPSKTPKYNNTEECPSHL